MPSSAGAMPGCSRSVAAARARHPSVYGRPSTAMLLRLLYWLAVLAISLALVVGLILWFESQDQSSLQGSSLSPLPHPRGQLALQPGEGDDPLGGAVERVASGQDEPVVALLA